MENGFFDIHGYDNYEINEKGEIRRKIDKEYVIKYTRLVSKGDYVYVDAKKTRVCVLMFIAFNPYRIENLNGYKNISINMVDFIDGDFKNNSIDNIKIKDEFIYKIYEKDKRKVIDDNEALKYWDYKKNNKMGVHPSQKTRGSACEVWWKCDKGHSYKRGINNQLNSGTCKVCMKYNNISLPQQKLYSIFKKNFKDVELEKVMSKGKGNGSGRFSADIYIKDINLIIEYDGSAWHRTKEKIELDKEKFRLYNQELGCSLIRVREEGCYSYFCDSNEKVIYYNYSEDVKNDFSVLKNIGHYICMLYKEDVYRLKEDDYIHYNNSIWYREDNKLFDKHPYLEDYYSKKNKGLKEYITVNSNKYLLWECIECGHEFKDMPNVIYKKKKENICPKCKLEREEENKKNRKKKPIVKKKYKDYRGAIRPIQYNGHKIKELKKCKECGVRIVRGDSKGYCSVKCATKGSQQFSVTKEELESLLKETPNFTELGELFNVSDNAVRKRCKSFGLSSKSSYWSNLFLEEKGYTYRTHKIYEELKNKDKEKINYVLENYGKYTPTNIKESKGITDSLFNCIVIKHILDK